MNSKDRKKIEGLNRQAQTALGKLHELQHLLGVLACAEEEKFENVIEAFGETEQAHKLEQTFQILEEAQAEVYEAHTNLENAIALLDEVVE